MHDSTPPAPPPGDSTATLLTRARAGDPAAIEALFARCLPLRRFAHGRLPQWARDLADTQDVVQEAVIQTSEHLAVEALGKEADSISEVA